MENEQTNEEVLPPESSHIPATEEHAQAEEPAVQLPEYVDFYLTSPVIASLRGITLWAKILIGCTVFTTLLELLFGVAAVVQTKSSLNLSNLLLNLRSLASIFFGGLLVWLGVRFVQTMTAALKRRDTDALESAFGYQSSYFKWVFINMMVSLGAVLLSWLAK